MELAHAWRIAPHELFDYDDATLATMIRVLEDIRDEQNRHS
ncbi:hypothetical protein [Corynebacterium oculi]|nr:hypothetical protein [Corynebacterium oculi]